MAALQLNPKLNLFICFSPCSPTKCL